jgi:hypothetical protein
MSERVCANCRDQIRNGGHCNGVTYLDGRESDIKVDTCDNYAPVPVEEQEE